jgi:uncharacterized SAM-binding protein YcdF (DUF218 family)
MTTREDAASVGELMLSRGWKTAILVSHPLHLERARLLFLGQGLTVYTSPTNTNLASIPMRERVWLTSREAGGIVWASLEAAGLPAEWTAILSPYVYGSPGPEEAN